MQAVLIYWTIAAFYGFICTCWKPKEATDASEILANRFGSTPERVFQGFVVVSAVLWPLSIPLDLFWVVEHKLLKH